MVENVGVSNSSDQMIRLLSAKLHNVTQHSRRNHGLLKAENLPCSNAGLSLGVNSSRRGLVLVDRRT